jgi:molybdate transport system substrate-binding protein
MKFALTIHHYFASITALLLIFSLGCGRTDSKNISIACASNVQFAMEEICREFEKEHDLSTSLIIASSGKLTAQIIEGAPYDIFVSADMKFPNEVFKQGFAFAEPQLYAYGQLALVSTKSAMKADLHNLENPKINHIAIANPKIAPYGIAAEQVLRHYGYYEKIKDKLVFGESISQTNQFISTGAAEIGFTSYSSVKAFKNKDITYFSTFEEGSYSAIEQGVVQIKHSKKDPREAKMFYLFLFSEKAKEIFKNYGYKIPNGGLL